MRLKYTSGGVKLNDVSDFWSKVDIREIEACWDWKEGLWQNGYGRFKHHYKSWRSHRFVLALAGTLPENSDLVVRHLCHNRKCCNPLHLKVGTQQENVDDREARKKKMLAEAVQDGYDLKRLA